MSKYKNKETFSQDEIDKALRFLDVYFNSKTGQYRFFNSKKTLNLKNDILSFNLQNVLVNSRQKSEIILFILINKINNAVMENWLKNVEKHGVKNSLTKGRNITIAVDELHKFMGGSAGEYLIKFLFDTIKTVRKYGGLLIMGTQSLKDFALVEDVRNFSIQLLEQTQYKFILKISQEDIKDLDLLLPENNRLRQSEKDYISNADVGECLFIVGDNNKKMMRFFYNEYEENLWFRVQLEMDK